MNEWVALIQHDPAQATKYMIAIKAQNKIQGLLADPSLTISVEKYDEAQRLLAAAADDPATARRAAHMARLGQATMGPSPDRDTWQALIAADPDFAQDVCIALEAKAALLGLHTPQALLRSIATYRALSAEQQP